MRTPAEQAEAEALGAGYLHNADDAILACRGQGHSWPKLRAGRKLPKGVTAAAPPTRDGAWQITSTCRDCGMKRTLTTLPGGAIDHPAKYQYEPPAGYRAPKGAAVTRRDCLDESWRRLREQLADTARQGGPPELAPVFRPAAQQRK